MHMFLEMFAISENGFYQMQIPSEILTISEPDLCQTHMLWKKYKFSIILVIIGYGFQKIDYFPKSNTFAAGAFQKMQRR